MQTIVLQHAPFEDLGSIELWLCSKNISFKYIRLFKNEPLPKLEEADFIILLGGPMSVNDTQNHPWLQKEADWIANALASNKPMLGICLGAQLIAKAIGASVIANAHKELGWFPVVRRKAIDIKAGYGARQFYLPDTIEAFHWHGETFTLPPNAIRLAHSEGCNNQAFLYKEKVIGLQFHLECTPTWVQAVLKHCGEELSEPGPYVQSKERILSATPAQYTQSNQAMTELLSKLLPS